MLVCSILPTLNGCASSSDARIISAAVQQGIAETGVNLPPLPDDCRIKEAHAPLVAGAEIRSTLKREREATNKANARVDRCADHYDATAKALQASGDGV